ncbi:MAG: resolvase [Xanthobacteraceae bacterium]|nr:MAG: resolvase [Xanthobacteraceae bacterium]
MPVSIVHSILRTRLYTGWFEWNGKMIHGWHEPLVSVDLWERVQGVMDGRFAKKHRRMTHDFAFSGLIACSKSRLLGGRRDQEAVLRLLPSHRLRR